MKRTPRAYRELQPEERELVSGGALSDGEIDEYLSQYDDPNLQNAWKYANGILRNYDGWDMSQTAVFPFMKECVLSSCQ